MATTEKLTINQVEEVTNVDLSCKTCRGSGLSRNYSDDWLPVLLKLHEVGKTREQNRYPVGKDGRAALRQAWLDILDIWENEAKPLHIPVETAAKAIGVSKVSFHYSQREYGGRD